MTSIERLRTRGTPIELIHTYLVSGELEYAGHAYHTSVLELLYEEVQHEYPASTVRFLTRNALHRGRDTFNFDIDPNQTACSIALAPDTGLTCMQGPKANAKVYEINAVPVAYTTPSASEIQNTLVNGVDQIVSQLKKYLSNPKINQDELEIGIITDLSQTKLLQRKDKELVIESSAAMYAFYLA